jgi:hypothetical protein
MANSNKKVTVNVAADTKHFRVEINNATKSLERFRRQTEQAHGSGRVISNAFRGMARGAAALHGPLAGISGRLSAMATLLSSTSAAWISFGTVVSAAAASVIDGQRNLMKLEHQLARMEGVLTATGHAAGFTAEQIHDFARNLALDTLTDTNSVLDAAAALGTFSTITGDTFKTTLKLGQDMAEVMGTSLPSASMQLAKALDNPVLGLNSLRRAGVSFSEQQKEMIKDLAETGRLFEAQDMILAAVAAQLEGVAEAVAANTSVGAWDTFTQRVGEFNMAVAKLVKSNEIFKGFFDTVNEGLRQSAEFLDPSLMVDEDLKKAWEEAGKDLRNAFAIKERDQDKLLAGFSANKNYEAAVLRFEQLTKEINARRKAAADEAEAARKGEQIKEETAGELRRAYLEKQAREVEAVLIKHQQKLASIRSGTAGLQGDESTQNDLERDRGLAAIEAERARLEEKRLLVESTEESLGEMRTAILEKHTARYNEIIAERNREAAEEMMSNYQALQQWEDAYNEARVEGYTNAATAIGDTFSSLGSIAERGSRAAMTFAVLEKAAASVRIGANLAVALSEALKTTYPASIAAYAQVAALGASILAQFASMTKVGKRAAGGPVLPGNEYLVGEHGPELLRMGTQSGTVVPKGATNTSPNVNVNIIEDASRGGQVEQNGDNIQVFVAAAMSHLSDEFASGRGLFAAMENKYGLAR